MDSGNEQRGILMFDDLIFPFPFLLFAQYLYIIGIYGTTSNRDGIFPFSPFSLPLFGRYIMEI